MDYDNIIRICEQAIQIEPYEEELHICFMENLIDKGRITEAQNHYESYTSMLYKQFGIKPTAELQQVYKMLKSSGAELNDVDVLKRHTMLTRILPVLLLRQGIHSTLYTYWKNAEVRKNRAYSICGFADSE